MTYELEPFGVRPKLIELGGVKTDFSHEWIESSAFEPVSGLLQKRMDAGAKRAAGPEEPAKAIYKAATDGSSRLRYLVRQTCIKVLSGVALMSASLRRTGSRRAGRNPLYRFRSQVHVSRCIDASRQVRRNQSR